MNPNPRISKPHPHRSGHRCEVKDPSGRWVHGPTQSTEEEAVAAAAQKLANLDAAAAKTAGDPVPPDPAPDAGSVLPDPPNKKAVDTADQGPEAPGPGKEPAAIRILGPYPHYGYEGYRCRLVIGAGEQWAPTATTKALALRAAERMAATAQRQGSVTVRRAIEVHLDGKRAAGARAATLAGTRRALELFFMEMLDSPVRMLTERRAQEQYDKLRQFVDPRTQRPVSVATHRSYLSHARTWGRWLVTKGWVKASPLEVVKGVGKSRKGKRQLSLDEARCFYTTCVEEGSRGDMGAVAALACTLMATRSSEVLSRVVRDLDDGGRVLRVDDNLDTAFQTKTESSKRPIKIPTVLQPLFANLARGKTPSDPLFPGSLGGRKRRQWLLAQVRRLCTQAGVPVVCVHSLRGLMSTAAASAGESPELVAKVLGHTSSQMTRAHYIAPGVAEAAQLERGFQVLVQQPPALPA